MTNNDFLESQIQSRSSYKLLALISYILTTSRYIKTLFNSCERFLLGTLILDIRSIRISDLSYEPLSDLNHGITESGLRHASGPVNAKLPIRYLHTIHVNTTITITRIPAFGVYEIDPGVFIQNEFCCQLQEQAPKKLRQLV